MFSSLPPWPLVRAEKEGGERPSTRSRDYLHPRRQIIDSNCRSARLGIGSTDRSARAGKRQIMMRLGKRPFSHYFLAIPLVRAYYCTHALRMSPADRKSARSGPARRLAPRTGHIGHRWWNSNDDPPLLQGIVRLLPARRACDWHAR